MLCSYVSLAGSSAWTIDLVAQKYFSRVPIPAPVSSCADHVSTCRIEVESADHSSAMTRDDEKRHSGLGFLFLLAQIIQPQYIVRSAK